jgi:hypothetical protein
MSLKESLIRELEETRERYILLVNSIPESDYNLPTANPDWNVGDMLFHITLGPPTLAFETWMIANARGFFQFVLDYVPASMLERFNGLYARRGKRITPQSLIKAYEAGHARILSRLKRTAEADLSLSMVYPPEFVTMLSGVVSLERLFHYVKKHYDDHVHELGGLTSK